MWQYLEAEEQARTQRADRRTGGAGDRDGPFAHLFLEPTRRTPEAEHEFLVVLRPGRRESAASSERPPRTGFP